MRKIISIILAFTIMLSIMIPGSLSAASPETPGWEAAMEASLDWLQANIRPAPAVGSVGGEWAVLALARAGRVTINDRSIWIWQRNLERTLREVDRLQAAGHNIQNPPSAGTFPGDMRRWTDFQRATLALTALGIDATDFNGRDLTVMYRNFIPVSQRHALNQTINADIFALIALNSMPYEGNHDRFLNLILSEQNPNGTWNLGGVSLDTTAMALQALAPYYYNGDERVTEAVHSALDWLRLQTFPDPESTAQMIVALTALGPDFAEEAQYYVNLLLSWFDRNTGAFRRPSLNDPINIMATEQAAYALVAYWRLVNEMAALYNMYDAFTE